MPVLHAGETDVARVQRGGFGEQAHHVSRVETGFLDKEVEMLALTRQLERKGLLDEKVRGRHTDGALSRRSAKCTRVPPGAVVLRLFPDAAVSDCCHLIAFPSRSIASCMRSTEVV